MNDIVSKCESTYFFWRVLGTKCLKHAMGKNNLGHMILQSTYHINRLQTINLTNKEIQTNKSNVLRDYIQYWDSLGHFDGQGVNKI